MHSKSLAAETSLEIRSSHPVGYVWYVIALLTVVNLFNYMDRMALAVLMPFIKQDLTLTDGQLGLLVGFAFSLIYAVCGIPLARWADRGVRKHIVSLALATWSVMTAVSGAAQNFLQLFAARIGVGVGEAGCLPGSQSMLCDYVPLQQRSGVFAIHNFGMYGGIMVGMGLSGWLGETIGWRWAFVALGLPGIVLAAIVWVTLREPKRGAFDKHVDDTTPSLMQVAQALYRCRTYRWLLLFVIVNAFVQYGLTQWWPSFYSRVFGLSLTSIGVYLGVALGVGSGLGVLVGGLVATKVVHHNGRYPLMLGASSTLLAIPTAVGSLFIENQWTSIWLVALTGFFWSVSIGPVVATVYSVVRPRMRALTGATNAFLISILGTGLGPLSVGLLSDLLAPTLGAHSLRYALLLPVCLFPIMSIALYAASRTAPAELHPARI
jgi:predicted MFS family arabinose efflux permease